MIERFKSRPTLAALAAAAITALGVGGVAVAQSGSTPADQATQAESGAAEQPGAENSATDRDNVQDENGNDDASEQGEANDKGEANEKADGSEKADDDGAGGHADQPGDDAHEADGQE